MPIQTTDKANIKRSDGAKVEYSTNSGSSWTDIGAIKGGIQFTHNYDENNIQTNNAGKLGKTYYNQTISGSFDWINASNSVMADLSCGLYTLTTTSNTPIDTPPNQTVAASWTDKGIINLDIETSSSDSTKIVAASEPTLTSVSGAATGPLTANDDYYLIPDSNSFSGYSIVPNENGTATVSNTEVLTINYALVTPVAGSTLSAGTSVVDASELMLRLTHTDSAGLTRILTIKNAEVDSGAFVFDFNEPGSGEVETIPISFTGTLDTDETDGAQLLTYYAATGAV